MKSEILLSGEKNINSVNVDIYNKIELNVKEAKITEFTVNDVVNSTDIFDSERENNQIYRIYGRIEYLSLLNGLSNTYSKLTDFFKPVSTASRTILNSFRFYIVTPHSGTTYNNFTNTNKYRRSFLVLSDYIDFEIYNAGYTNNVYGEQVYAFSFKIDFDVSDYYDYFGFPLTELFLYAQYIKGKSTEEMSYTHWNLSTGLPSKLTLNTKTLTKGGDVETSAGTNIMDVVEYIPEEYFQVQVDEQKYFIRTPYTDGTTKWLEWSYNPFIPLRLRYFDSVISTSKLPEVIAGTTLFEVTSTNDSTQTITLTKSTKQSLTPTPAYLSYWDNQSNSSSFTWNPTSGVLKILVAGDYIIKFKTQIYLPYETDKYIGESYIVESLNVEIPDTRRKYLISGENEGTIITKTFSANDEIRVLVGLIPNPNERKVEIIPDYALMLKSTGNYVWRSILPQGYTDPLSSEGVDYPFFNGKRYLFSPIILDVPPNLSENTWEKHTNTIAVFNEISYSKNATEINIEPFDNDELNNIGKPCQ